MEQFVIRPSVLLLLILFLGLTTRLGNCQSANCTLLPVNLEACTPVLGINIGDGQPSPECCSSLGNITSIEANIGSAATCQCLTNVISDLLDDIGGLFNAIGGMSGLGEGITTTLEAGCGIKFGFTIGAC